MQYQPIRCPNCGNASNEDGIDHCALVWRVNEVLGVSGDVVVADGDTQEEADIDDDGEMTHKNIPNKYYDLAHLCCCRCRWNWAPEGAVSFVYRRPKQ